MTNGDWRLTNQLKYMKGATLRWRAYQAPSETWDHDHCEFCFIKFLPELWGDYVAAEGYVTDEDDRWVCKQCFEDFKELFEWRLAP